MTTTQTQRLLTPAVALVCFFFVYYPITNSDIFWHLASGREMYTHLRFLTADPFSFTPHDSTWVNLHWLFQLLVTGVHLVSGYQGLILLKGACAAFTAVLLLHAVPSKRSLVSTALVLTLLFFEARYLILTRPIMITMVSIGLFIWCLERFVATGRTRYLLWLPAWQLVWTNSQGLSILGPVIAATYAAGEWIGGVLRNRGVVSSEQTPDSRTPARLAALGAALLAVTVINPYGWRGMAFPFRLFTRLDPSLRNVFSDNISENMPLLNLLSAEPRLVIATLLTAATTLITFVLLGKRTRTSHVLLSCCFLGLALMAKRNALLFFLVAGPVLGHNLSLLAHTRQGRARAMSTILTPGAVALVVLNCLLHGLVLARCPSGKPLSPFRYPVGAVEYLKTHWVRGNVFNSDRFGGYLLWKMYPTKQVFIDGRFILRSPAFFAEYLLILDRPELFDHVAPKFDISHALLQTAIFDRYLPLAGKLYHDPGWNLVYADGASALFVESSQPGHANLDLGATEVVDSVSASLRQRWGGGTAVAREAVWHWKRFVAAMRE